MALVNQYEVDTFQEKIFNWWKDNTRIFPWRENIDPYHILVSEIMLQQTQASRVIPKFNNFIEKFPNLKTLNNGTNAQVLKEWIGLGYNRRAIWLKNASEILLNDPSKFSIPKELIKIKGIGKYTSFSIPIFAFNADYATVDVNIKKIFVYENFISQNANDNEFYDLANALLPLGKSRDWHNALMDYGNAKYTSRKYSLSKQITNPKNQSFIGSDRYYRGKIIKYVSHNNTTNLSDLKMYLKLPSDLLEQIIRKLEKDGLLQINDQQITL